MNTKATPHPAEAFLSGASAAYFEQTYLQWKQDPQSVHSVSGNLHVFLGLFSC